MSTKYVLEMNEEQAREIMNACEFHMRVMRGQFNDIAYETMMRHIGDDDYCECREDMEAALLEARKYAFPELYGAGHSHGVGFSRETDLDYNVLQVIRHAIAWHDNPDGGYTIDFSRPIDFSNVGMPTIRVIEQEDA